MHGGQHGDLGAGLLHDGAEAREARTRTRRRSKARGALGRRRGREKNSGRSVMGGGLAGVGAPAGPDVVPACRTDTGPEVAGAGRGLPRVHRRRRRRPGASLARCSGCGCSVCDASQPWPRAPTLGLARRGARVENSGRAPNPGRKAMQFKALVVEKDAGGNTAAEVRMLVARRPAAGRGDGGGAPLDANYKDGLILGWARPRPDLSARPRLDFSGVVEPLRTPAGRRATKSSSPAGGWGRPLGGFRREGAGQCRLAGPPARRPVPRQSMALGTAGFTAMLAIRLSRRTACRRAEGRCWSPARPEAWGSSRSRPWRGATRSPR